MTVEFGRQLRAYREPKFPVRQVLACLVRLDNGFLGHIERGDKNTSPHAAELFAESLCIPLYERARFFLRGAGFSEERISTALDSPYGVCVTTSLPQDEPITAGAYIRMYMSGKYKSDEELARITYTNNSTIWRLRHNKRLAKALIAESLVKALQIPPERQAEFLLLVIGHRPEVVHQVLTALKENSAVPTSGDLEEGEPLALLQG